MHKQISLKIVALTFGILTAVFLAAFYVVAWQEPSQAPPGGNVATPINVGTAPQAKAGRISATEFYDYNDPSYYLNPSGNSVFGGDLTVGGSGNISGNFQIGGIPSWSGKSFSGWISVPITSQQEVCKNLSCSGGWSNCRGNCKQTCENSGCSALGTFKNACEIPCGGDYVGDSTMNGCGYWVGASECSGRQGYDDCGPILYQCKCSCPSNTYFWVPAFK